MTRAALSTEGELRRRCCTLGALKEARRRIRASCAFIRLNLSTAIDRSLQRSVQTPYYYYYYSYKLDPQEQKLDVTIMKK